MKRILREPLLHFLLLGAVLFAAYGVLSGSGASELGRIVVMQGKIDNLQASFSRVWQRPASQAELDGLVQDYIREEVLAREAMALGLDKDDTVIRRRLRQKMEFISDDISAQAQPTDAELSAYLQAHPDSFRVEQRFTFSQVYLNPEKHGQNLARDAASREWANARRLEANEKFYQDLLKRYTVTIENPEPVVDSVKSLIGTSGDTRYGIRDTGKNRP